MPSQLDDAAAALRAGIEGLDFEQVCARFEERTQALRARQQELGRCWDGLSAALASVVTRIEEKSGELRQACERTVTGLTGVVGPLQERSESMADAVDLALEAASGLAAAPAALIEPVSSALLSQGLEPATELVVATQELADVTKESLEAVASVIGPEFFEVAENSQAMARLNITTLDQTAGSVSTALSGDFEDWAIRMSHAVSHVDEDGYKPAGAHADAAVTAALQQCRSDQETVFRRVDGSLDSAHASVAQLVEAMSRLGTAVQERAAGMTQAGSDLLGALGEAQPALAAVRDFLVANGFGPAS